MLIEILMKYHYTPYRIAKAGKDYNAVMDVQEELSYNDGECKMVQLFGNFLQS